MPTSLPDRVSVAVVLLQPECNMTCTFCVTEDGYDSIRFEEALALLDGLRGRGVRSVVFGGGEPFTWPGNVLRLAAEAKARGMTVQVGTNGVALPGGFAELDCIDRWVLPLESTDPAVHQALRLHGRGHHALVLDRLRALQRARKPVTISTVLTAVNVDGILDLARFLDDYHAVSGNVHAWHLYRFLPLGREGARHRAELDIAAETYAAACASVKELGLPFRVFRRSDMYRSSSVEFFWSEKGRMRSGGERLRERASRVD
jgi:MoaA/NifB/PqqE/SkfB family radical SAM enzyme